MAKVYAFEGKFPKVDPTAFVHPDAVLIGDVIVGPGCYVGPCACLRGDFGGVRLEEGVNVQDTCVLHSAPGEEVRVEKDGHVGHGAVLHGCVVGPNAMVGMNAVVMNRAVIGDSAIVAACAFVKTGLSVPPAMLAAGVPAVVVRALTEEELRRKAAGTRAYQELARRSLVSMEPVPLGSSGDAPAETTAPHDAGRG